MARAAGRATGQAAAFLSRSRTKLLQLGKDNEIAEVQLFLRLLFTLPRPRLLSACA